MQRQKHIEGVYRTVGEVWSDLHHEIIPDKEGGIKKVINVEAVRTSIDNILRTYPMERVMRPYFASHIQRLVFNPLSEDLEDLIREECMTKITRYDDRVIVNGIDVTRIPERHQVNITVSFSIRGYDQIFQHNSVFASGVQ